MTHVVTPLHFPKPRGYANGIVASGRQLFISGQIAWDKEARIVSTDFATQFLQALDNVIAVVREAGGGTQHLVKLTVFVTDLDAYRASTRDIGEGWRARMGKHYPAMSLVKVAGLLEPGAMVEIEGIAMLPESSVVVLGGGGEGERR
jgi:enamine deaminase RidA (YjgF/YER057c/UK114 family)